MKWAGNRYASTYYAGMASSIDQREKVEPEPASQDAGYDAWKRAKVERGLAQSRDRATMIPVEQVLRDLSLEG
ncbi:hypothetical protein [Sphingomonas sp. 1P08PE]|uniref:hypothetical protein n=1 Tax=Sphingomonas sp. 1P08PE TaxID=554122 RepID=UPI0039A3785A